MTLQGTAVVSTFQLSATFSVAAVDGGIAARQLCDLVTTFTGYFYRHGTRRAGLTDYLHGAAVPLFPRTGGILILQSQSCASNQCLQCVTRSTAGYSHEQTSC